MTLLHIDTDLGVDDALALFVASRLPGVAIAAISTVFGNVPLATATRNARLLRHLLPLASSLLILAGAAKPSGPSEVAGAAAVHGTDGLGGATQIIDPRVLQQMSLPAVHDGDLAARIAAGPPSHVAPGQKITLVGLGPATNLPALAAWYGDSLSNIVLLSGAFFDRGNITKAAEFNAASDPQALAATIRLNLDLTIVPLDLCRKILLPHETIRRWPALEPSPATRFLAAAHEHYVDVYRTAEGIDGCFPHDTIAVLAACRPAPFFTVPGNITVAETGQTRLQIDKHSPARILTGGDLAWLRTGFERLLF